MVSDYSWVLTVSQHYEVTHRDLPLMVTDHELPL